MKEEHVRLRKAPASEPDSLKDVTALSAARIFGDRNCQPLPQHGAGL